MENCQPRWTNGHRAFLWWAAAIGNISRTGIGTTTTTQWVKITKKYLLYLPKCMNEKKIVWYKNITHIWSRSWKRTRLNFHDIRESSLCKVLWMDGTPSTAENLKNIMHLMQTYNTIQDSKNVSSNLVNIKLCSTYL